MLRTRTIGALAFLVTLLPGVSTAIAADVTLRYAGTLPATHHNGEGQYMLAKRVQELTNGSVEIEVYPAGQLYKAREIPTAIVSGGADMGYNLTSVWSTDSVSEINDIPLPLCKPCACSQGLGSRWRIAQGIFRTDGISRHEDSPRDVLRIAVRFRQQQSADEGGQRL